MTDPRRALPSVNALLDIAEAAGLLETSPRALVVAAARDTIERARLRPETAPHDAGEWARHMSSAVERAQLPSLRPVLNGTGVIVHTNLGRAPLADAALSAIAATAAGYSNLEYDIESGARGSRYAHCADLLQELTGAQDALVVNNNAGALVLALNTLADGRECLVSRGELVEIGGSFRVPEIVSKSGARLIEVGTTNRTHAEDYRRAAGSGTAAIAKFHRSNFAMEGFVAEVPAADLARLGRDLSIPVVHDLGSGLIVSLERCGLRGEPTARDAVSAGASVITMSGDKLLGGPQAGIILGGREEVAAMRANPLTRSYRVDKLTLAALEATLALYRDPERAFREIPVLAQLSADVATLRSRAENVVNRLPPGSATIVESAAGVGGGAFPTATIPSVAISIADDAVAIERKLRTGALPLISRIQQGAVQIDMRTILPREDQALGAALETVLS